MTAAAFVKGFLDLEGELTPILASLVRTVYSSSLLDDADPASDMMTRIKKRLMKGTYIFSFLPASQSRWRLSFQTLGAALTTAIDPRQPNMSSTPLSESDVAGSALKERKRGATHDGVFNDTATFIDLFLAQIQRDPTRMVL